MKERCLSFGYVVSPCHGKQQFVETDRQTPQFRVITLHYNQESLWQAIVRLCSQHTPYTRNLELLNHDRNNQRQGHELAGTIRLFQARF